MGDPNRHSLLLRPVKSPSQEFTFRNLAAVSPYDFPRNRSEFFLLINNVYIVSAYPLDSFPQGRIGLHDLQRSWMSVALTDQITVSIIPPLQISLVHADIEVAFASLRKKTDAPYDQDALEMKVRETLVGTSLQPEEPFLLDVANIPLRCHVKTVQVTDLSRAGGEKPGDTQTDPRYPGIVSEASSFNFFKSPNNGVNLKSSSKRPSTTSIVAPDFKFQNLGIGGLDTEFATIFRRAFVSRIFPRAVIDRVGIQHVKGLLLYGPPGTGKTLIARQIGQMLNARPPKIINGPEVLNKYVGQSEENIRKLFADAEKEYKEKGDDSGLHIIIFDELDAVCKQRGSGSGGGTGVGDSVVNQLLSKLDGVDQLNNILLIGMTNRKDMIDDALLRPGRLEVHVEISLPDEKGRVQILNIHTQKARSNNALDDDVDIAELARLTKNFSGAEISGLVKSATSFAFGRHTKVDNAAGVKDDIDQLKITFNDFRSALDEVKPAFGVSEEDLHGAIRHGIIHYSPFIRDVLAEGGLFVAQVRDATPLFSVLLYGSAGSGKTALAAKIALDSDYPFIKFIAPESMVGMGEASKIQYLIKTFDDAYKSALSVVVLDSIERIIEYTPIGPRFSNSVLQTLISLLRKVPPNGRKLLILATTAERSLLSQLDIFREFSSNISVPNVMTYQQLGYLMQESRAFGGQDVDRALREIKDVTRAEKLDIGVKGVLEGIETAKKDSDMAGRFAGVVARLVAEKTN